MGTGADVATDDTILASKMNSKLENDGVGLSRVVHYSSFLCPVPATEWAPSAKGAELPASITAKKCWVRLDGLAAGDIITSFIILGDITEAATATLDAKLCYTDNADPVTENDVANGGMTQEDADGLVDSSTNNDDYTVVTDQMPYIEFVGTTGVADAIVVQGVEVSVTRLV